MSGTWNATWERLIAEVLRHMIREFLAHPAELFTFRKLSYRIASDPDVPYAIAEFNPADEDHFPDSDVRWVGAVLEYIGEFQLAVALGYQNGLVRIRECPCHGFLTENMLARQERVDDDWRVRGRRRANDDDVYV